MDGLTLILIIVGIFILRKNLALLIPLSFPIFIWILLAFFRFFCFDEIPGLEDERLKGQCGYFMDDSISQCQKRSVAMVEYTQPFEPKEIRQKYKVYLAKDSPTSETCLLFFRKFRWGGMRLALAARYHSKYIQGNPPTHYFGTPIAFAFHRLAKDDFGFGRCYDYPDWPKTLVLPPMPLPSNFP